MVKCDVCGEDMTNESNITMVGLKVGFDELPRLPRKFRIPRKSGKVHHEICRVLEHFGKTEFKICYVCVLKSLGVKERKDKI